MLPFSNKTVTDQSFYSCVEDNLPAAMTACQAAGWCMYTGKATFDYLQEKTGFDLYSGLRRRTEKEMFFIDRRES